MIFFFFVSEILPLGINDTLLVLIPKSPHSKTLSQLRPISLCNVAYKIITTLMKNRPKRIIPLVISSNQSSFVLRHRIIDNIVIYQEVLHSMRTRKAGKGIMILKRLMDEFLRASSDKYYKS